MRIGICDDNSIFLRQMQDLLLLWSSQTNQSLIAEVFEDGDSLIHAHSTAPFDVLLLDVVMPLFNGMEAAREIRQVDKNVKIVFLTSSPEFAVESYTVKASNYLLKPLNPEAFFKCMDELAEEMRSSGKYLTVRSANTLHRLTLDSIEYLEAQNKHVLFSLSDGRSFLTAEPLYTYEGKLSLEDGFFKCSRSYIVNIHQIDTYTLKEIKMRSGCRIPISRNLQREFEAAYFNVLFGQTNEVP